MKMITRHASSTLADGHHSRVEAALLLFTALRAPIGLRSCASLLGVLALCAFGFSTPAETVGFIADPAGPFGGAGNNGGLNIGHTFTVTGSGIQVFSLGVYDYQGNGLNGSHVVTLFSDSGATHTPVSGGSITVPAGTGTTLKDGFRFAPLPSPVTLPAGNYSVIVYQMNGGANSDGYAEANNTGFIGDGKVSSSGFTTFDFSGATSPTYPGASSTGGDLASASFTYAPILSASDYAPIAFTPGSFNRDAVVESGAPSASLNGNYTTVSMDNGTGNSGFSWYEMGYNAAAVKTGIPNAGSTISSAAASDHYFTFAPSYAAKNVAYIDISHSDTLTLATPGFYSTLSFLTSAGHGPVTLNYSVNHADGTSETGSFNSPDWFNNSPVAWTANGRVDVGNAGLNSVNGNNPRLYSLDIALLNSGSQVVSIGLSTSTSAGHQAVVFAVSGQVAAVAPTAPFNIAVAPLVQTQDVSGAALFSATASGTLPFTYHWFKGASPIAGATNGTLLLSGITSNDTASYSCAIGNAAGTNLTANASLTVLPLPAGFAGAVLTDLPLAYYRLNEPGPILPVIAANSGTVGPAGNGVYFPGGLQQVPGAIVGHNDTAAGYTGIDNNSQDGAVPTLVPFNPDLNPNGSFTVEAWLNPSLQGNLGNAQAPLNNQYNDVNGNRFGWDFFQRAAATQTPDGNGPGYSFRMFNGTAGSGAKLFNITGGLYQVGAWSHLVAVYDATVPSATLYLNGVQVAQSSSPVGTYAPNSAVAFAIGGYQDARQNPFDGAIDEVAIYTNALNASQVLAHYQNGTNAARGTPYSALILADSPAEYLRLDEPAGNTAVNNGLLSTLADGTYSHTANGLAGPQAPLFGGFESQNLAPFFNASNSYVELENPAGLNFTGPITLEAWILPAASQGFESYILAHGYNDDNSGEVYLRMENGVYQVGSLFGHASFAAGADLGGGSWVHLAGTYDGANWNLYRNGVPVGSGADSVGPTLVNNANWAVGARGKWRYAENYPDSGLDRQFNGLIDEVAIYNHALSAARIQAHYAASVQPLKIALVTGTPVLTWAIGVLQEADSVDGPYTDVSGASSPYSPPVGGPGKFYRLHF
jgi:hypothetical protein